MQSGNDVDNTDGISNELPTQQMRRYRAPRRAAGCIMAIQGKTIILWNFKLIK